MVGVVGTAVVGLVVVTLVALEDPVVGAVVGITVVVAIVVPVVGAVVGRIDVVEDVPSPPDTFQQPTMQTIKITKTKLVANILFIGNPPPVRWFSYPTLQVDRATAGAGVSMHVPSGTGIAGHR